MSSKITEIINKEIAEFEEKFGYELADDAYFLTPEVEKAVTNFLRLSYSRLLQGVVGEVEAMAPSLTYHEGNDKELMFYVASSTKKQVIALIKAPLSQNEGWKKK